MGTTVGEFFNLWRDGTIGNEVRPDWRRTRNSLMKRVLTVCAAVVMDDLRPEHLWAVQKLCREDGLAPISINQTVHKSLRAMLSAAVAVGSADEERVRRLYRSVKKVRTTPSTARHPCTREQRDAILDAISKGPRPWGYAFAAWGFSTGMRLGESMGLTFADVDTVRRWARVVRSRDGKYVGPPKTRASVREIPISRSAVAALATIQRGSAHEYIFRGPRGGLLERANYESDIWRPALAEVGLAGWPLYCVRHSFISWQLETDAMTIAEVAAYCGTSVAEITATYGKYTRRFKDVDLDSALETVTVRPVAKLRTGKA